MTPDLPANPAPADTTAKPYHLLPATPEKLQLTNLTDLFDWYRVHLCGKQLVDPRGQRVHFLDTDFVHLIKLVDKYGREPKNARMTIEQIQSGRIVLNPLRMNIQRAQELTWAQQLITEPDLIVPNWQPLGRANPGDAYIKNFAIPGAKPVFRVLICGHEGRKRRAVTIFPRERFAEVEIATVLWP